MNVNTSVPEATGDILFSIVMPTYNRAALISKAIDSVLKQTYRHFELIVVNDGGTDNTEELVRKFNDPRIQYYWKKNEQKGIAKNFGFSKAKGLYVCSFDDDDIMYPHHLQTALDLIKKHNCPEIAYVHYNIINENGEVIAKPVTLSGDIADTIVRQNPLSNNGVFLHKKLLEEYSYYPSPELKLSADWLLWLRLSAKYKFHYTNEATHGVLVHQNRGSASAKPEVYMRNKEIFLEELKKDKLFMEKFPGAIRRIRAYYNTYIALFLSVQGFKLSTIKYFLAGVFGNPAEIFRRRTLAIAKYLLIRW